MWRRHGIGCSQPSRDTSACQLSAPLAAGCGPASRDGEHVLVALANGEIVKVHSGRPEFVFGGFHAGSEMPEMLLHLRD